MKTVEGFDVTIHGVENRQYFQGVSCVFTDFTDYAVGIGFTCAEAFEDALEQLSDQDWDVNNIHASENMPEENVYQVLNIEETDIETTDELECYWCVSIRVK